MEMRSHQTARVALGWHAFQLAQILWDTGDFLGRLPGKGEVQLGSAVILPYLSEPPVLHALRSNSAIPAGEKMGGLPGSAHQSRFRGWLAARSCQRSRIRLALSSLNGTSLWRSWQLGDTGERQVCIKISLLFTQKPTTQGKPKGWPHKPTDLYNSQRSAC